MLLQQRSANPEESLECSIMHAGNSVEGASRAHNHADFLSKLNLNVQISL